MKDFWLSCGHHLLDRDAGGGLMVTDEFLKVYLARPELSPPPVACVVEKTLHAALMSDPRRAVSVDEIAAIIAGSAKWTGEWFEFGSINCRATQVHAYPESLRH